MACQRLGATAAVGLLQRMYPVKASQMALDGSPGVTFNRAWASLGGPWGSGKPVGG
jgi:hypothetical protein